MRRRRDSWGEALTTGANDFVDPYGNPPRLPPELPELTDEQLFALLPSRWERALAKSERRR